jgi:hypothetical protein
MAEDLRDRFETTDGSAPEATPLDAALARKHLIPAFALLEGGDVFELRGGKPPPEGPARAAAYARTRVELIAHGAGPALQDRVRQDIARQLAGNLALCARMELAKPIAIDLIPPGVSMAKYGYPRAVSARASGLFWNHPDWPKARIALRQDRLEAEPHLVFHELAHAIAALAFTSAEREAMHRSMLRTYRSRNAVEEVFAIYSEREFTGAATTDDLRAPGVYGMARQRWSEEHLFTRFVRNLYFPYKPLAGPGGRQGDRAFV